jgi:very-short-patch-repair endonuclease
MEVTDNWRHHGSNRVMAALIQLQRLFEAQHGVVHRRQLLSMGLTRSAIQERLAAGHWEAVLPSTYRLVGAPRTWHQSVMAACLWAGPEAVASHRTAAALLDLPGFKPGIIEITTSRRLAAKGVVVHRCRMNARIDTTTFNGIPITAAHRTIIDLCAVSSPDRVERALDAVLVRGLGEVGFMWRQLNRLGSVGRRGVRRLRSMLSERSERLHHAGSDSETLLHQLLRKAGIDGWQSQVEIIEGEFSARPDVVFRALGLIVEVDSWSWHTDKAQRRYDIRRQNRLETLGWTVLRFFREDVLHDPEYVLGEIRATLKRLSQAPLAR